jgi:hypothetical protein
MIQRGGYIQCWFCILLLFCKILDLALKMRGWVSNISNQIKAGTVIKTKVHIMTAVQHVKDVDKCTREMLIEGMR